MPGLKALLSREITRNPALLTTAHALRAALFPIPVITIFWQEQIGMPLADIMALQSIFAVTIVILEFPSGYVAANILQKDAPPDDRASVLSLNALLFRLAASIVLPPVGMLADHWGLDFVLTGLAVTLGGLSFLLWRAFAAAHPHHSEA